MKLTPRDTPSPRHCGIRRDFIFSLLRTLGRQSISIDDLASFFKLVWTPIMRFYLFVTVSKGMCDLWGFSLSAPSRTEPVAVLFCSSISLYLRQSFWRKRDSCSETGWDSKEDVSLHVVLRTNASKIYLTLIKKFNRFILLHVISELFNNEYLSRVGAPAYPGDKVVSHYGSYQVPISNPSVQFSFRYKCRCKNSAVVQQYQN